jgi:predicted Zn-dependent peptidase
MPRRGPTPFALLAAITTLAPVPAPGRPAEPFRLPVEELVLDNGMRVLLAPRPGVALVAAGWAVRAGSGEETATTAGVAHLVEHLLHDGSARVSASDYARHYTEAGAVGIDARTDRDLSAYFLRLPAERLELWFWLESDRLLHPELDGVQGELPVIAEERRQRLESTPTGAVDEELQRLVWGDHPYGWPAGGSPATLAALRPGDAAAFFATHYRPGNLTAVLVGDFAPARVRELARRYFGRLPAGSNAGATVGARARAGGGDATPPGDPDTGARTAGAGTAGAAAAGTAAGDGPAGERVVDRSCACPPQARIVYRTVDVDHPDRPALDVLAGVLSGRTGRLHRGLVVERGLAFSAGARHEARRRGGVFAVELEARGAVAPRELVAAWDAELARVQAAPPAAEELERVRNGVTLGAWRGLRAPLDFALRLLVADAQGGWRSIETWPTAVQAVDAAAVQRVATQYLRADQRLVARIARGPRR